MNEAIVFDAHDDDILELTARHFNESGSTLDLYTKQHFDAKKHEIFRSAG
jgi:hypothetical protein